MLTLRLYVRVFLYLVWCCHMSDLKIIFQLVLPVACYYLLLLFQAANCFYVLYFSS